MLQRLSLRYYRLQDQSVALVDRAEMFPPHAKCQRQPGFDLPGIAEIERQIVLAVVAVLSGAPGTYPEVWLVALKVCVTWLKIPATLARMLDALLNAVLLMEAFAGAGKSVVAGPFGLF